MATPRRGIHYVNLDRLNINPHAHNPNPYAEDPAIADGTIYETDEFRMFSYKVVSCPKRYSHDWTSCPYTHAGERARRRDPLTYLPIQCPFYKDDEVCRRGESCIYAHGIFEYWLHPGKYRTKPCTNGPDCDRQVCFFAHSAQELRDQDEFRWDHAQHMYSSLRPHHILAGEDVERPVVIPPRLSRPSTCTNCCHCTNSTSAFPAATARTSAVDSTSTHVAGGSLYLPRARASASTSTTAAGSSPSHSIWSSYSGLPLWNSALRTGEASTSAATDGEDEHLGWIKELMKDWL